VLHSGKFYSNKFYSICTCSELVCLSKPVNELTIEKTLAHNKICPFPVNYEALMF
jgi:hypothetical protein